MARDEYKVHLVDQRGRRSFTLVNATSSAEAKMRAAMYHGKNGKKVTVAVKTGRTF